MIASNARFQATVISGLHPLMTASEAIRWACRNTVGAMQSSVDLTYLADTVVLSRYFEARGAVRLAISIIKKRSGNHERTIREYQFTPNGIVIGPPLDNMQGVLTGVPTFLPEGPLYDSAAKAKVAAA